MKILQAPTSQGSLGKNKGCELAPAAILKALRKKIETEIVAVDPLNIEVTQENIFKAVDKEKGTCILLGGDHSITQASFQAFCRHYKKPGLLMFDAHPDCTNNFKTTHEDFVHVLISEGILDPQRFAQVGIRAGAPQELAFLKDHNVRVYFMDRIHNIEYLCDEIMEYFRDCDGLYITVDIDVLDPSQAPGTGYLEPAGMTTRELLYFLQRLKTLPQFKMLDIVEVNPEKDVNAITVGTAARIVQEFL